MPNKASKLLEGMRHSKANWTPDDLLTLYKGFGFVVENRHKHSWVWHPDYPQLYAAVPRHRKLAIGYVVDAVKNIDRLNKLKELDREDSTDERH